MLKHVTNAQNVRRIFYSSAPHQSISNQRKDKRRFTSLEGQTEVELTVGKNGGSINWREKRRFNLLMGKSEVKLRWKTTEVQLTGWTNGGSTQWSDTRRFNTRAGQPEVQLTGGTNRGSTHRRDKGRRVLHG